MLVRRLGISLSDRERVIHDAEMIVTEIAAGEPRSTAANEVHGDSFAGSAPCNGQLFRAWHDEVGIALHWRGQWDCSGDVHNRDLALDVRCTKAGADDYSISSDYSIQPAVIEVLTANLI
ncbi:unnamed protein product, partial [Symbiodinium sp. KB8]